VSTTRGAGVRPAGAPMVPMTPMPPPTPGGGSSSGGAGGGALGAHAQEIAGAAKRATGEVRREAMREVDRRSTMAGERVAETAGDLRRMAQMMRDEGRTAPAQLMEGAAGRVDGLADYLSSSDPSRMMQDVRTFARKSPALLVGGAVVLGLAIGRLVKAADTGGGGSTTTRREGMPA
jgi:hypothetical protein